MYNVLKEKTMRTYFDKEVLQQKIKQILEETVIKVRKI